MPLSQSDAAHLLRRVGVMGNQEEIDHFAGRERADAVDEILALEPTLPARPGFAESRSVWPGIVDFRQWWVNRMVNARWVNRAAATPSPLEEKMTLFWHSHFATAASKVEDLRVIWGQNNLFRRRSTGSFHTLLSEVTTHGALLFHLDNQQNTVEDLQENFARELMELYTTGPDHFTEEDVVEMARAWTGHGTIGWIGYWDQRYRFYPSDHDNSPKTLFGQTANFDGPDTIALFTNGVRKEATARFIATKLWRYMVSDEVPASAIDDLAAAWSPTMNLTDLLRALLLHDGFWADEARFALVRSPIEFAVAVLRQLGLASGDSGIHYLMDDMGQALLEPPSVAGWGTGRDWLSTQTLWGKARFVGGLRWNDDVWRRFYDAGDSDVRESITPRQAANRIINVLGIPDPSPGTRQMLEDFWTDHVNGDDRWAAKYNSVIVGTLAPEFQVS
ncbi:MAG: DUF1800 domain-containing protein [Acidimicrobiales bacterium]